MNNSIHRPVWVEVNLENIEYNLQQVKKQVDESTLIMPVVKADAYGHGLLPVAKTLIEAGADCLAVAFPFEGIELREEGFQCPIQVLTQLSSAQLSTVVDYNLIPTISRRAPLLQLEELCQKGDTQIKIHLAVDTGMGRMGVLPADILDLASAAKQCSRLTVEGLMTHFASADEANKEYTYRQWDNFQRAINILEDQGIDIPLKQAANSAAVIDLPEMKLDLVRPGIMIYGLPPSKEVKNFNLKPALSWKTEVIEVRELPQDFGISYGVTYTTPERRKLVTLPLGYADGYPRSLSNKGEVLIRGQRAPIRGRICMDQTIVDVTDIKNVEIGDQVVVLGTQNGGQITATELADWVGTINYEIVTRISSRVPRIYSSEV